MSGRYIPAPIRRQLRQEAGFGCAKCGNALLQYHHIIPWAEEKHNNPEHMVALCGHCHDSVGKLPRHVAYDLKKKPYNVKVGKINGLLGTDKVQPSFILGSSVFVRTPIIFQYFGIPIFEYEVLENQNLISAYIPKHDFWPELKIERNDLTIWTKGLWDIEFRTNFLKIQRKTRDTTLEIDLRGEHAKVSASIVIRGERFEFGKGGTSFGDTLLGSGCFKDCPAGIVIGNENERILKPSLAQRHPRAALYTKGQSIKWI